MKAQLIEIGEQKTETRLAWYCPGCKCNHDVPIPPHSQAWEWNGSLNAPTLSPSVLRTSGHHAPKHQGSCWCNLKPAINEPPPFQCMRCHCFVRDGRIEFLGDCSHELAGQTVEMREES